MNNFLGQRKLALFDIDNTLYDGHVVTDFPKYLVANEVIDEKFIIEQENAFEKYLKQSIDYEELAKLWLEAMAQSLQGLSINSIQEIVGNFFEIKDLNYFYQIAADLHAKEYDIYIISAEPQFIGQSLVDNFGLKGEISSKFEVENNKFTGKTISLLNSKEAKHAALVEYLQRYPYTGSLACGDSIIDLEMLRNVENPICVNPSKELANIAQENSWICTSREELHKALSFVA